MDRIRRKIRGPLFDVDRIQVASGHVVLLCIVVSTCHKVHEAKLVAEPLTKKEEDGRFLVIGKETFFFPDLLPTTPLLPTTYYLPTYHHHHHHHHHQLPALVTASQLASSSSY